MEQDGWERCRHVGEVRGSAQHIPTWYFGGQGRAVHVDISSVDEGLGWAMFVAGAPPKELGTSGTALCEILPGISATTVRSESARTAIGSMPALCLCS